MEFNNIEDITKVAVLLRVIGTKYFSLIHSLVKPEDEMLKELLDALEAHLDPPPVLIAERFRFYQQLQGEQESVKLFVVDLHRLVTNCKFGNKLGDALKDRLVCGLKSSLEGAWK